MYKLIESVLFSIDSVVVSENSVIFWKLCGNVNPCFKDVVAFSLKILDTVSFPIVISVGSVTSSVDVRFSIGKATIVVLGSGGSVSFLTDSVVVGAVLDIFVVVDVSVSISVDSVVASADSVVVSVDSVAVSVNSVVVSSISSISVVVDASVDEVRYVVVVSETSLELLRIRWY